MIGPLALDAFDFTSFSIASSEDTFPNRTLTCSSKSRQRCAISSITRTLFNVHKLAGSRPQDVIFVDTGVLPAGLKLKSGSPDGNPIKFNPMVNCCYSNCTEEKVDTIRNSR